MLGVTHLSLGELTEEGGNWRLQCVRCLEFIGTVSMETLREAVDVKKNKGGVLCPECRSISCEVCGDPLSQVRLRHGCGKCGVCELDNKGDWFIAGGLPECKPFVCTSTCHLSSCPYLSERLEDEAG